MQQFWIEVASQLKGFPPELIEFAAPFLGSLAISMVDHPANWREFIRSLIVGYLAGAFCGPIFAPFLNFPKYTIAFVSGASGFWLMTKWLKKKQQEMEDNVKPPGIG